MTESIKSIAVKSLGLPKEIEDQVQAIANSGGGADLDTIQEFEAARAFLNKISLGVRNPLTQLQPLNDNMARIQISESAVTVVQGGVRYKCSFVPHRDGGSYLVFKNMQTQKRIFSKVWVRSQFFPLLQIATDGKGVYAIFKSTAVGTRVIAQVHGDFSTGNVDQSWNNDNDFSRATFRSKNGRLYLNAEHFRSGERSSTRLGGTSNKIESQSVNTTGSYSPSEGFYSTFGGRMGPLPVTQEAPSYWRWGQ